MGGGGGAFPALKVTPNSSGLSTTSQPEVTLQLPAGTGAIIDMAVDAAGFVWLTDGVSLHRADPRDEGSMIRVHRGLPTGTISSLRQHPSGYAAATVDGVEFAVTNDFAKPAPTNLPASAWREVARLPCGNHDIAAAVLGSFMYISGGLAPGGFPNQYRVFDEVWSFDGDVWEAVGRMPGRRTFSGIAAAGDELWICGGADGAEGETGEPANRTPRADCFVFNPASGAWRQAPSMRTARIECWSCFVNGRVYTFGGASKSAGGDSFSSVESIAPTGENEWRAEPPMPLEYGLRQYGGCVLDGKVYLVGGCDEHSGDPSNRAFLCFDPASGTWEHSCTSDPHGATLPAHPAPPNAPLVATHGDKVWVIAGNPPGQQGPLNHGADDTGIAPSPVYVYTPGSGWERGPDFPTHQSWGAAHSFKGKLYAISGAHGTGGKGNITFDPRCFVLEE